MEPQARRYSAFMALVIIAGPHAMGAPADNRVPLHYRQVTFRDLSGWDRDGHSEAFQAFLASCGRLAPEWTAIANSAAADGNTGIEAPATRAAQGEGALGSEQAIATGLLCACDAARELAGRTKQTISDLDARRFFETHFQPHRVIHDGPGGFVTGYYEPLLRGSRAAGGPFSVPVYRRPPDLITLVDESQRGAMNGSMTHGRLSIGGVIPYQTRAEIENGGLAGQGLELAYLEDRVDLFFLQVQGSGLIELTDGSQIRIGYDGKNGYPYTSIGKLLIEQGEISAGQMSLQVLTAWLKAHPERARDIMWANKSYVFFKEFGGGEKSSPQGVRAIPLTKGRSLAIDAGYHQLGLPIHVSAPELVHAGPVSGASAEITGARSPSGFHRLMIAQDVGSAIKGPERGDIYFGSGEHAGQAAGQTKHSATFHVLLPDPGAQTAVGRLERAPRGDVARPNPIGQR